eukprot:4960439-Pyramimonas_sp.AAC.1
MGPGWRVAPQRGGPDLAVRQARRRFPTVHHTSHTGASFGASGKPRNVQRCWDWRLPSSVLDG